VPAQQRKRQQEGRELCEDETRCVSRPDAGECIGQRPSDRHGRVGKRSRGGKPIGAGDVSPDRGAFIGDWGVVCAESRKSNSKALFAELCILSAY